MGAPRIGIVDSGGPADAMRAARAFLSEGKAPAVPDRLGHGTACAALIPQSDLILLSLGLAADRMVLAQACAEARRAGAVLVASAPARGGPCWPAAYAGVIAATGDARCGWDQLSLLPGGRIGAWCASPEHGGTGMGGASLGAARIAGHLAANWQDARVAGDEVVNPATKKVLAGLRGHRRICRRMILEWADRLTGSARKPVMRHAMMRAAAPV